MRADRVFAYGATAGLLGDLILGDPRRGHPVAAFGRAAGAVERVLWRDHRGWGALHTAVCVGGAVSLAAAGRSRSYGPSRTASVALTAAATWAVVGGTSLGREARAVGRSLEAGDIEGARERLPHLCGRDPQALDADGIARAVVESVAENTSDAVVGALVWGALGGVPGLVGFRAVNTLDAMVGHRSPRYRRYGWASARLDDVAGWPGARLTAVLAAVAGGDPRGAVRAWRADAGTSSQSQRRARGGLVRGGAGRSARRDAVLRRAGRAPACAQRGVRAGCPRARRRAGRTAVAARHLAGPRCQCRRAASRPTGTRRGVPHEWWGSGRWSARRRDHLRRRQECRHRRDLPVAGAAGGQGRAVQGAEHVPQLLRHAGGRRDRAGAGHAGAGAPDRADGADEPGTAQARQRPEQSGRAHGEARGRDECARLPRRAAAAASRDRAGVPRRTAGHV